MREWLALHETKISTKPYWLAAAGFTLFCFMVMPLIAGMTRLTPLSPYYLNPPFGGPQVFQPTGPKSLTPLVPTQSSPPTVTSPGPTGPSSAGIAGVATGATPAGGATGAANVGLSAGATSAAPSVGGNQP